MAFAVAGPAAAAAPHSADPMTNTAAVVETVNTSAAGQGTMAQLTGSAPDLGASKLVADDSGKAKSDNKSNKKAPSSSELHPRKVQGGQQSFKPSKEQLRNAAAIVKAGQDLKVPPRAMVIAMATAMQESTLHNYGHLGANNDHDSQGLFQQRPSSGWGTPEQITNPDYATKAFLKSLLQVDGWEKMPLTKAAQKVQVSAYPDHYAKWEKQAGDLVRAFYGDGPYAGSVQSLK